MAESTQKYVTKSAAEKVMSKDVLEAFKLVNWPKKRTSTKIFHSKFGEIDFKTMSLTRAKQLVKLGFPYLEENKSNSSS